MEDIYKIRSIIDGAALITDTETDYANDTLSSIGSFYKDDVLQDVNIVIENLNDIYKDKENIKEMIEANLFSSLSNLLQQLSTIGYLSTRLTKKISFGCLQLLWNITDYDSVATMEIIKTAIPKTLMNIMLDVVLVATADDKDVSTLLHMSIKIIRNILRYPGTTKYFSQQDFRRSLFVFVKNAASDNIVGLHCLFVLANTSRKKIDVLKKAVKFVKMLTDLLRKVNNSTEQNVELSRLELLIDFNELSSNEDVRNSIMEYNSLRQIIKVLKQTATDKETEISLKIIEKFCFDFHSINQLEKKYKIHEILEKYCKYESDPIQQICNKILILLSSKNELILNEQRFRKDSLCGEYFSKKLGLERTLSQTFLLNCDEIQKESDNAESLVVDEKHFDAYFSYAWDDEENVKRVMMELKNCNLKLWIDKEQMKGDTFEAMAEGIESSKVFLMAVSEYYFRSRSCHDEAEYAYRMNKPIIPIIVQVDYKPHSWLGFIMGAKKYVRFGGKQDFNLSLNSLLENISHTLSGGNEDNQNYYEFNSQYNKITSIDQVQKWSKSNIRDWIMRSNLNSIEVCLKELNGEILYFFLSCLQTSFDELKSTLKANYDIPDNDIVKLSEAIRDLSHSINKEVYV